ncbi:hypothetical protein ACE38W_11550 [Chitinophaga sp. Hz27]|uniref:hypothetical protein n=1 Tax=Chitinophaga sp. Hz27 TaxID=3347169 RepID=UPI0035E1837A
MKNRRKISLLTKYLSNKHYLKEVPVDGKITNRFHFDLGWYYLYANQIIRTGNCITLLSNPYTITIDSFWNTNHFEDISKYVFWTFNDSFQQNLIRQLAFLSESVIARCNELLTRYVIPYNEADYTHPDEELQWCFVKNEFLKKSGKYELMYCRDQENRTAIKSALAAFMNRTSVEQTSIVAPAETVPTFLSMLIPINGSQLVTLNYIDEKVKETGCKFEIFRSIRKSKDNRNPYGFNGCVAAVIDYFYQLNYFDTAYSLEQIFHAYFEHTGNYIAKFSTFMSEFRQDNSYLKHVEMLKQLKINKLN